MLATAASSSTGLPSSSPGQGTSFGSLSAAYPLLLNPKESACPGASAVANETLLSHTRCGAEVQRKVGRASLSPDIPMHECRRVLADLRDYCSTQQPLGDVDLEKYVCMYDSVCTQVRRASTSASLVTPQVGAPCTRRPPRLT